MMITANQRIILSVLLTSSLSSCFIRSARLSNILTPKHNKAKTRLIEYSLL